MQLGAGRSRRAALSPPTARTTGTCASTPSARAAKLFSRAYGAWPDAATRTHRTGRGDAGVRRCAGSRAYRLRAPTMRTWRTWPRSSRTACCSAPSGGRVQRQPDLTVLAPAVLRVGQPSATMRRSADACGRQPLQARLLVAADGAAVLAARRRRALPATRHCRTSRAQWSPTSPVSSRTGGRLFSGSAPTVCSRCCRCPGTGTSMVWSVEQPLADELMAAPESSRRPGGRGDRAPAWAGWSMITAAGRLPAAACAGAASWFGLALRWWGTPRIICTRSRGRASTSASRTRASWRRSC